MLARRVEHLLRKYIKVTEQVEDLGELPAVPLASKDEKPESDIVASIDKEVLEDRENRLKDLLVELFDNDAIEINKEVDFSYIIDFDGNKLSLSFKVVDGEGIAVLVDKGLPCTVSFTPFFKKTFASVLDLVDELMESEEALKELVSVVRKVVGVVDEESATPPEEAESPSEEPVESKAESRKAKLREILEKLREMKKLVKEVPLQEQEEDEQEKKGFEVRKVADTEVKYTQVELPMEGEVAVKALERMKLADITKKISENPSAPYPDIIGFVQEPKEV